MPRIPQIRVTLSTRTARTIWTTTLEVLVIVGILTGVCGIPCLGAFVVAKGIALMLLLKPVARYTLDFVLRFA